MSVHYTSLGIVNTRVMFATAVQGGFAVPAYNFNNMEQLQAIIMACLETQSPVIIQVSKGARDYADRTLLSHMAHGAVEMMKREAGEKAAGEIPIVLHGSSSIPQDAVETINRYGGSLKDSVGIPEEQLREAARSAVCKINIDSDGRLVMTAKIREVFSRKPEEFDPRKYLGPAREALRAMYGRKNRDVLGSAGRAPEIMRAMKG